MAITGNYLLRVLEYHPVRIRWLVGDTHGHPVGWYSFIDFVASMYLGYHLLSRWVH